MLELAATIDLEGVPFCGLCLMDLTEEIRHGRKPSPALIKRTTDWVWTESGKAVREVVVQARMDERPFAEEALHDIDLNGWRGVFAEAVVLRLAHQLADHFGAYSD
jgi:hypothetical protein